MRYFSQLNVRVHKNLVFHRFDELLPTRPLLPLINHRFKQKIFDDTRIVEVGLESQWDFMGVVIVNVYQLLAEFFNSRFGLTSAGFTNFNTTL